MKAKWTTVVMAIAMVALPAVAVAQDGGTPQGPGEGDPVQVQDGTMAQVRDQVQTGDLTRTRAKVQLKTREQLQVEDPARTQIQAQDKAQVRENVQAGVPAEPPSAETSAP